MDKPELVTAKLYLADPMNAYINQLQANIAGQKAAIIRLQDSLSAKNSTIFDLKQRLVDAAATKTDIAREKERLREAVFSFAQAMIDKLEQKVDEGEYGWDNNEWADISIKRHIRSETTAYNIDPVDVANYSMFLWAKKKRLED